MRISSFSRYALCSCVAAGMLAGCSGSQPPIGAYGAPGAMPQSPAIATHAALVGSWVQPEAKSGDLLYAITTGERYVYVMTYPEIRFAYKLGPFRNTATTQGLCTDTFGNVYVVTTARNQADIYVYKHDSTTSTRVLQVRAGSRFCSVDPATGDLAVVFDDAYQGVAIYRKARGSPKTYKFANAHFLFYLAYGDDGKLYVSQAPINGQAGVAVVANGQLHFIALGKAITQLLKLQWNRGLLIGTTVAHGAPPNYRQEVYLIKLEEQHQGRVVQSLALDRKSKERPYYNYAGWIQGNTLIAPDHGLGTLDFWKYPQGGDPERSVHVTADGYFTGMVISRGVDAPTTRESVRSAAFNVATSKAK